MSNFILVFLKSVKAIFNSSANTHISQNWQYGFQTPYSPIAEGIIHFHDDLVIFLTLILFFVLYILYACFSYFKYDPRSKKNNLTSDFVHHPVLEIIWTIIPAIILIIIAIPSFSLLYSVDELIEPLFTVKVVGHQWYWYYELMSSLEVSDAYFGEGVNEDLFPDTSFDSYLLPENEFNKYSLSAIRLLTVDNHLLLPTNTNIRVIVTAADVLHSWAVPSLGVKLDACPGRLNQTSLYIEYPGLYYGQCSEICGVNHGFMPIGIASFDLLYTNDINILFDIDPLVLTLQNMENDEHYGRVRTFRSYVKHIKMLGR